MSKEKSKQLANCPFCGGEAKLMRFPKCERKYVVICENEQCMASVGNYSHSKEKAIKAWNTRKPLERIVERLEEENTLIKEQRKEAIEYDDEQMIFATNNQVRAFDYSLRVIKEEGGINEI